MNRLNLDLGKARVDFLIKMKRWKYLFIGKCTGDVTLKFDSLSASEMDPTEFDKLTEIEKYKRLYITNTAQSGKVLAIYFEPEDEDEDIEGVKVRGMSR